VPVFELSTVSFLSVQTLAAKGASSSANMLLSTLFIAVFGASTTFATPLVGSLGASKHDGRSKHGPLPHLDGRDMNKADLTQLPRASTLISGL
jgi:hypothetical protein